MNEALRDWVTNVDDTYYLIGTAAGPHPYPEMVRDFQSVIGIEAKEQMLEAEGRLPDLIIAAVGGGSNAIGMFHPFLDDASVKIVGVEAGGKGCRATSIAPRSPPVRPACCTATAPICCRMRRPDQGRPFDLGRPRLSRHRPRAFLAERYRPRRICADHGPRGA
jgi:hypothetical protein